MEIQKPQKPRGMTRREWGGYKSWITRKAHAKAKKQAAKKVKNNE